MKITLLFQFGYHVNLSDRMDIKCFTYFTLQYHLISAKTNKNANFLLVLRDLCVHECMYECVYMWCASATELLQFELAFSDGANTQQEEIKVKEEIKKQTKQKKIKQKIQIFCKQLEIKEKQQRCVRTIEHTYKLEQ